MLAVIISLYIWYKRLNDNDSMIMYSSIKHFHIYMVSFLSVIKRCLFCISSRVQYITQTDAIWKYGIVSLVFNLAHYGLQLT